MKIRTYKNGDIFPENCWFADYQPRKGSLKEIIKGDIVIRKRNENSTDCLFTIPVGGIRGITENKAEIITNVILETLNRKGEK